MSSSDRKTVSTKSNSAKKKGRPAIGRDLRDSDVAEADTKIRLNKAKTANAIAWVLMAAILVSLGASAIYGFRKDDLSAFQTVWLAVGPLVGALIAYYFRRRD